MRSRILLLLLALVLGQAAPPPARAQSNNTAQDWQDLQDLKPGKRILVKFKPNIGDEVDGDFVSAIGTKLTLSSSGYTRSLEQRDIQSVYRLNGRWSRGKAARVGMVVGAVVGGVLDASVINPIDRPVVPGKDDGTPSLGGVIFGGLAGAGSGWLLGGKRIGKLLYDAQ